MLRVLHRTQILHPCAAALAIIPGETAELQQYCTEQVQGAPKHLVRALEGVFTAELR